MINSRVIKVTGSYMKEHYVKRRIDKAREIRFLYAITHSLSLFLLLLYTKLCSYIAKRALTC